MLYCKACSEGHDVPPCPCGGERTVVYTGDAHCKACGRIFSHDALGGDHKLERAMKPVELMRIAYRSKDR